MADAGKRVYDVLRITGIMTVGLILTGTAVLTYKNTRFASLEGTFWVNRAGNFKSPVRARTSSDKPLDVATPQGWHGAVELDDGSERLEMNLLDRYGKPVRGLRIAATIARSDNPSRPVRRLMAIEQDGIYRTGKLNLGKGRWDITVTARDENATDRPPLKFRVEKQLMVK